VPDEVGFVTRRHGIEGGIEDVARVSRGQLVSGREFGKIGTFVVLL